MYTTWIHNNQGTAESMLKTLADLFVPNMVTQQPMFYIRGVMQYPSLVYEHNDCNLSIMVLVELVIATSSTQYLSALLSREAYSKSMRHYLTMSAMPGSGLEAFHSCV